MGVKKEVNYIERIKLDKRNARKRVAYALKVGKLVKGCCMVCRTTVAVEAHHEDYDYPLEVSWLCRPHHLIHHEYTKEKTR